MNYIITVQVEDFNEDKIKSIIKKSPKNFEHYETTGYITHSIYSPSKHLLLFELYNITAKNTSQLARDLYIYTFGILGGTILEFSVLRTAIYDDLNQIHTGLRHDKPIIDSPLFNTRSKNDK